jgi:hypothetical protein
MSTKLLTVIGALPLRTNVPGGLERLDGIQVLEQQALGRHDRGEGAVHDRGNRERGAGQESHLAPAAFAEPGAEQEPRPHRRRTFHRLARAASA